MFNKKCAQCGSKFTRLGCAPGGCGWIGQILGGLFCFILFGGTSKYCPSCRGSIKESGGKVDKGFLFRVIWFVAAIAILVIIAKVAVR